MELVLAILFSFVYMISLFLSVTETRNDPWNLE